MPEGVDAHELDELTAAAGADLGPAIVSAVAMADLVVQRGRAARANDTDGRT
jgi:hypothetical protein